MDIGFELTGTVLHFTPRHPSYFLSDRTGSTRIIYCEENRPSSGDVISCSGTLVKQSSGPSYAMCTNLAILSRGQIPTVRAATLAEVKAGQFDYQRVRVCGTVREIFCDEIDPNWYYVVLTEHDKSIYATVPVHADTVDLTKKLTDAYVSIAGICTPWDYGVRLNLGRVLSAEGTNSIQILRPPPHDPFNASSVLSASFQNPEDISPSERRRLTGKVLSVWKRSRALVRDAENGVHTVTFANERLPHCGTVIDAVGFLKTDLYRLNITHAIWRPRAEQWADDGPPETISAKDLFIDDTGRRRINAAYHGRLVKLEGVVKDCPVGDSQYGLLTVSCDGINIPVDIDANRAVLSDLGIGCRIAATGTCVIETDNWHTYASFPHTTGITLVIRDPTDIRVVSRPPWWTTARLLVVMATLAMMLVAILLWNRTLRRRVEKRGHQLYLARIAQIKSISRIEERTRLAVELHDSIAQDLTGIALEVNTANRMADTDIARLHHHLNHAGKALNSCRNELRNCIWDLRSRAIECPDMNDAIRCALTPHIGNAQLTVEFNAPRSKLSDNTTHVILRIIRELSINAIRHGKASAIRVSGSMTGNELRFSVLDDGVGFDPQNSPGAAQGHFGLLGIQERIDRFEGRMAITSKGRDGTCVTIQITLPPIPAENDHPL